MTRPTEPANPVRDAYLDVLTFNVHVGQAIYHGGLRWLRRRYPGADLIALNEVQSRRAKAAARLVLRPIRWRATRTSSGTIVYSRRRRFKRLDTTDRPLTGYLGRMHPARRLVSTRLLDRRTGRVVDLTAVHTWHIHGHELGDGTRVTEGHLAQVRAIAEHHADQPHDTIQAAAGDWNENLRTMLGVPSARRIMLDVADMLPAARIRDVEGDTDLGLDEVFIRPAEFLKVIRREVTRVPRRGVDHPAVWVRILVQAKA